MSKTKHNVCKIAIVGAGGVGKSALVTRWLKEFFDDEYVPTVQDYFEKTMKLDGRPILVEILDTAGQEEYEALRDTYMREEEGFLLDKGSAVELNQFYQQITRLKSKQDKVPMVIIGNKCDLEGKRKVFKKEITQLSDDWGIPFMETSAKTDVNVDMAFTQIVRECLRLRTGDNGGSSSKNSGSQCCTIM